MRTVADIFNVSVGFVHHVVDLHRTHGQVTDPYIKPRNRHRLLTFADEDYIRILIEARPSIYLDEIQEGLLFERRVQVSITTILRTITRMQISKKSLSRRATEHNEQL